MCGIAISRLHCEFSSVLEDNITDRSGLSLVVAFRSHEPGKRNVLRETVLVAFVSANLVKNISS